MRPHFAPSLASLLLSVVGGLFAWTAVAAAPAELFVAPDGKDINPGTLAGPFATLERARDEVRSLKQGGRLGGQGINIWIRGGDYLRTNALELNQPDSGAAGPIVWGAYKGERPRLIGGVKLSRFQPVTDKEVLDRLPEPARSRVVQTDLSALGIRDFGEMKSRGFGRATTPAHCELFFAGRPMVLARWPNEGAWETIAGFPAENAQNDGHGGKIGKLEYGFFYEGDRPRNWKVTNDLWVHGYWSWDWANSYERVGSIDLGRRLVNTARPYGLYGFRKGQRFYFLNLLEELDSPGEWFLDRETGVLYFWPPANPGADAEILMSLLAQPLLKLIDVSDVIFRGLTLEATRGNAVEIQGGASNMLAGCMLRNIGNTGVSIDGGWCHGVLSCDIFDTGDGGVSLNGGDRRTLRPGGHFVENCHFARQGRWSKCYVPAVLMGGVGMRATHNLIHDHPHCAILFNGNDHLVAFNEIHHIALETGDVGAIYTGRDYTYRGNQIRHNFIHHTGGVGMGSMGVYMDDCVSGTEIFGNIFYKVQRAAFLGGGRDHQVVNNLFVDCNYAVELDGRGLDKSPVWHEMVDQTMRKRLDDVPLALYRERYPAMKSLDQHYGPPGGPVLQGDAFKGVPPENNLVARNVCVGKWLNVYWHATPQMLRLDNNLTNAEALFVRLPDEQTPARSDRDLQPADFALKADSAAWPLGFQSIPFEKIGLQPDKARQRLQLP
jgi:hypothetical protein